MKAVLLDARVVAPEVKHLTFEVPDMDRFPFEPGQFISLYHDFEGKTITRAYSTAGVPHGNRFEICLNLVREGRFSPLLHGMQPGEAVDFKGPFGTFIWRPEVADSILVATGTGITPFRGMLQARLADLRDRRISLVYGARHREGLIYREEFEQLAHDYPSFQFLPTLSRPDAEWTGKTGYVQGHVMEILGERRDMDVYICGLKAMVDDMRAQLKEAGLDRKRIIYEKYD